MEIQPSPQTDKDFAPKDDIAPMDEHPRPIAIRALDRVVTTRPGSVSGG
jgi:hypothetical protein